MMEGLEIQTVAPIELEVQMNDDHQALESQPSSSASLIEERAPPSVRANQPLIESYTYHSVDGEVLDKGKGRETNDLDAKGAENETIQGEWMLGVDEAGRGPVLGPQVYGIAYCRIPYEDEMREIGFADSKTLTAERRAALLNAIMENEDNIKWAATVMSPHDISKGMLKRNPYNLNAQSHDCTINLIREVLERNYNITQCFVDTVGVASDYQRKLESLFPTITFTVTSKADALYPIVSAASIVAKVTRDHVIDGWKFMEVGYEEGESSKDFGSGYPSDPKTVAWLEKNFEPVFGYPNVARFSWQPVKTMFLKKGYKVKWDDEPSSIQKYFSADDASASTTTVQPNLFFKDFSLVSVGGF